MAKRETPAQQKRAAREQRILDAAGALLMRWGYNKTTIDDIARSAGVAKGTIYLHWKTRDDLFAALLLRERLAMVEDFRQRLVQDAEGATLHGMLRHSALALLQRPLLKAALLRDTNVIGRLAQQGVGEDMLIERLDGFRTYLEFLRDHGMVRTDMDIRTQTVMLGAVFMGFFMVSPLMPQSWQLGDEELAEAIAETVRRALEPPRPISEQQVAAAATVFLEYVDRDKNMVASQLQRNAANQPQEQ